MADDASASEAPETEPETAAPAAVTAAEAPTGDDSVAAAAAVVAAAAEAAAAALEAAPAAQAPTPEKRAREEEEPPLAPGWTEAKDPRYGNATYWFNAVTRETSWTRPTGAPADERFDAYVQAKRAREDVTDPAYSTYISGHPNGATLKDEIARWVKAKKDKDFGVADAIRAQLRQRGIDPEKAMNQIGVGGETSR